jgi:hypothetical protein
VTEALFTFENGRLQFEEDQLMFIAPNPKNNPNIIPLNLESSLYLSLLR